METSQNWFVKILIAIVVLAVIVVGLIYFVRADKAPPLVVDNTNNSNFEVPAENTGSAMNIIAKHQFRNGEHILAGEIGLPTPCHILSTNLGSVSPDSKKVVINFVSATKSEACAQVITQARFKVEFEASADAEIRATWNGRPATLNLFPVGANEDLKDFDLFIKG